MNKTDLAYGISLFVLTAGLASCSKEQTTKDTYKTPPPMIVTQKGNQGLLQWDRLSDKTLDLQDSLDVSAGNPSKVEINASCMREKFNIAKNFKVNGRRAIKIFQIIPQDILFDDLSKVSVACEWEIVLYNDAGSKHIIRISSAPLADRGAGEVLLEGTKPEEKIKSLHSLKASGVKIRYRNEQAAAAEIVCRDVTFDALPFEQAMDFTQFDLRKPRLREGKSALEVRTRPLQPCRVVIKESGATKQLSEPVQIQIPRKPLVLKINPVLAAHPPSPNPKQLIFGMNPNVHYANVVVENIEDVYRTVKLPKVFHAHLDAMTVYNGGNWAQDRFIMNLPWMKIPPMENAKELPDGWLIKIVPKSSIAVPIIFVREHYGCWKRYNIFIGMKISPSAFSIQELSDHNEVIDQWPVQLPSATAGTSENQLNAQPANPKPCL